HVLYPITEGFILSCPALTHWPHRAAATHGPAHRQSRPPPRPRRRDRLLGGRIRLARGRDLAVLGTPGRRPHAHRPRVAQLALAPAPRRRRGDRRALPGGGARSVRRPGAARVDGGPAVPPVLPVVPLLVQDLERGDGGGQRLHVPARRPDDLAHGGTRGRLHA